mmetsp:Transcript_11973/g.12036  ORF Transcript_11973/g.12036 Transcript_11973/m.12036 type:complete len:200 (-) Transcript_11973:53-652(-)
MLTCSCSCHSHSDCSSPNKCYRVVMSRSEVFDTDGTCSTCSHVRQKTILLKDPQRSSICCITHHENSRSRGQSFLDILVKRDICEFDCPSSSSFYVSAFNMAITRSSNCRFMYTDMHRNRDIDLIFSKHTESFLYGCIDFFRRFHLGSNKLIVKQPWSGCSFKISPLRETLSRRRSDNTRSDHSHNFKGGDFKKLYEEY